MKNNQQNPRIQRINILLDFPEIDFPQMFNYSILSLYPNQIMQGNATNSDPSKEK